VPAEVALVAGALQADLDAGFVCIDMAHDANPTTIAAGEAEPVGPEAAGDQRVEGVVMIARATLR